MSQISTPVRILLAGAVVFLAAWFTVLHPKAATVAPVAPASTPTGVFNGAVSKAKAAAATAEKAGKAAAGESGTTTESGSATATTGKSSAKPAAPAAIAAAEFKGLPKNVAAALNSHKTIVLGVIADGATRLRPLSDDDRYVRNALRHVNRYDGQVVVKTVPVGSLAAYSPIVGDLQVNQTPSVVVVDVDRKARVLTGYVDSISINQAIANGRRDSISPLISDPYLRTLNRYCQQYVTSEQRWSWPTSDTRKALVSSLDVRVALEQRYHRLLVRIPAPARWHSLKAQFVDSQGRLTTTIDQKVAAFKHSQAETFSAAGVANWHPGHTLDARLDKLGVTSCVADRRS